MDVQHSIHLAASRSGLSAHVIRAWEKRYSAVSPDRTDTNRRRYTDAEIDRLRLLRIATQSGHRIGDVARLPTPTLRELVTGPQYEAPGVVPRAGAPHSGDDALEQAITAIKNLDTSALAAVLDGASVTFGQHGMLEGLVSPLARRVGELWADGTIAAAHEHFASNVLRSHLLQGSRAFAEDASAPLAIVATPAGQLHEIGAAIAAAATCDLGWRVIYLGPSLPAPEIAGAAIRHAARAVALSIVFPGDDSALPDELRRLRKLLPAHVDIVVGGAAADAYEEVLRAIAAVRVNDLTGLARYLTNVRMPSSS